MKVAAIVPAAGHGKRLGGRTAKPFVRLAGKPIVVHTLENLGRSLGFAEIVVAADRLRVPAMKDLLKRHGLAAVRVVAGGKTRAESVWRGLLAVSEDCEWVLVHDAARPLVSPKLVREVFGAARRAGAAILAEPVPATVKKVKPASLTVAVTEDRRFLYLAQTPQVFRRKTLLERYRRVGPRAFSATDEASLFDGSPVRVKIVKGSKENLKITTPEDLELFEFYFRRGRNKV